MTDGKIADKTLNNVCHQGNATIWLCGYKNLDKQVNAGEAIDPRGHSLLLTMPNGADTVGPRLKASYKAGHSLDSQSSGSILRYSMECLCVHNQSKPAQGLAIVLYMFVPKCKHPVSATVDERIAKP